MPQKKPPAKNRNLPGILSGAMMALIGLAFTLTGIGAIVGVPLFLAGFIIAGFFLMRQRAETRSRKN